MKCPEVVEWMHRYLDNDLSEENTSEMMEHIAHCPQCVESFRILSMLSRELEALPQVTPRYSLVDAIMPQLDAIDRARLEKSASQERPPNEMVPVSRVSNPKRQFFTSTAARTMIGAAAAVVILGVAIYNYSPQEISDAQMQYTEQADAGTETANSTNDKVMSSGSDNDTGVSSYNSDTQVTSDPTAGDRSNVGQTTTDPTQGKEPTQPSESNKPAEASIDPKSSDLSSKQAPDGTKQTPKDTEPSPKVGSDKSTAPESSRKVSPEPEQDPMSKLDVETPKDTKAGEPEPIEGMTVNPVPNQDSLMTGIQSFSLRSESWDSPDGKVRAALEDQKLVIYHLPVGTETEKTIIQSIDLVDTWVSGEWSSDSTIFTYKITLDDKVSTFTYNVPAVITP